jgi:cytochrome c biogenesis protein CcmG, thiol:disulfide interchange protein DsbE
MKIRHVTLVAFTLLGLVFCAGSPVEARTKVGEPAPAFRATTFEGAKVDLESYKGDVLVINIWATWCGPCKKELPLLDSYLRATSKYGLKVLAITTEDSAPNSYLKPLQKLLAFPLVKGFRGSYRAIDGAVPSNFVIDRNGVLRYAKAGAFDLDTLNEILVPLLKEPRPTTQ